MEFTPGSVHKAVATFSNPKTAGFDYKASLCMGAGWTEMASASFHLDAGQSKGIEFPVTMPTTLGTYPVYFKVTSGGVLIGTFTATEAVVISAPVNIDLISFIWDATPPFGISSRHVWTLTMKNMLSVPAVYRLIFYVNDTWFMGYKADLAGNEVRTESQPYQCDYKGTFIFKVRAWLYDLGEGVPPTSWVIYNTKPLLDEIISTITVA